MKPTLRLLVALFVSAAISLLAADAASAQKKDNIQDKAKELLKNYKPPAPTIPAPKETPQEAWEKYFQNKNKHERKTNAVEPSSGQYKNAARSEAIRKSSETGSKPLTPAEIRKAADDLHQREITSGRGEAWELAKRGFKAGTPLTPDEIKKQAALKPEGIPQKALSDVEIKSKFSESIARDRAAGTGEFAPSKPSGVAASSPLVGGYVYNDLNRSATKDTNEAGIKAYPMRLEHYNTGLWDTVYTDSMGYFEFHHLDTVAEYYYIQEIDSAGWYHTNQSGYGWFYFNPTDTNKNIFSFGNWWIKPAHISGVIFNDLNRNGVKDTLEPGLETWVIRLYESGTGLNYYDTTDAEGKFHFDSLMHPGWYYVYEVTHAGWFESLPTNNSYGYYVFGDSLTNVYFGNWLIPWQKISGVKFNDLNGNGVKDAGEPGIPGWHITLYRYSDGSVFDLVTDATGTWTFADSGWASYYNVYEVNQPGWLVTLPYRSQGANYYFYSVADTLTGKDFGNWFVPPGSIAGTVFHDLNNNSIRDTSDPGLQYWVIHARNDDTGDTLTTITDSLGHYRFDNLSWVHYYRIWEDQQLDWINTYPSGGYWHPQVVGDTVTADFGQYLPTPETLRVNTMPSYSVSVAYGNAVAGTPVDVWGNVHGGLVPLRYVLEYGDGEADSGVVTNRRFVGGKHTYTFAGTYTMALTVHDSLGASDTKSSIVRVFAVASKQIRVNMAIEKGLLYLYLNQYPDGHWYDNSDPAAATGASVLSMEENGHLSANSIYTDIYAEYVKMGLDYLFAHAATGGIAVQAHGNPDSNGDGIGTYFTGSGYANGIACLAILGSHKSGTEAQQDTIRVGVFSGKTYFDYMVDAIDMLSYSQQDAGQQRGGWRYSAVGDGGADNSATQWPGLVLEAAQSSWGMSIQQFVKDELLIWLQQSQDQTGGFGYTDSAYWNNIAKTGSGIGSYAFLGYSSASQPVVKALDFINLHWNDVSDGNGAREQFSGNLYAMYAVAKAMRISDNRAGILDIGSHDWYDEYCTQLLDNATWGQQADGTWAEGQYLSGNTNTSTSFGILILTRGVIIPPPVAVISPVSSVPPSTSFQVDGSQSFHQDPQKSIVEWLWIWNTANGIDWNHPNASGTRPTNPGYPDTGLFTIALRVKDNSDPPMYAIATAKVRVKKDHNPPVAVAIPPGRGPSYAAKIDEPILLDGRASYSPDYPKDSVVAYNWDLNGDGLFGDATTDTVTVVFHSTHSGSVGLRVYDTHGDSSSNTAYITVVASRTDVFAAQFSVDPSPIYPGDSLHMFGIFKNNDSSNSDANHVLVRFFDNDPLTTGNRVGGDYYIDLPVGVLDTLDVKAVLPVGTTPGTHHFYAFIDPTDQLSEWNKANNLKSADAWVLPLLPYTVLDRHSLNFATVDSGGKLTLPIKLWNTGRASLVIDSLVVDSAGFSVEEATPITVPVKDSTVLNVDFMPDRRGSFNANLKIYSNDTTFHVVRLFGQGELAPNGTLEEVFRGLVTIDNVNAARLSAVLAYRTDGTLIKAVLVWVDPDSIQGNVNYMLTLKQGQAGIADGDTIMFRVESISSDRLYETYCEPLAIFHPATPADTLTHDVAALHDARMAIPVFAGYNAVSWNVNPEHPAVTDVFNSILAAQKVKIIIDYINDGVHPAGFQYYIPGLGDYSPLKTTNVKKGYFVRLNSDATPDSLIVRGVPVCATNPIPLETGYNFVSYLPAVAESVKHALSSLDTADLVLALDWNRVGGFFDNYPNGNFRLMAPTKGYFLRVDTPMVLSYPAVPTLFAKSHPAATIAGGLKTPKNTSGAGLGIPEAVFVYGKNIRIGGRTVPTGSEIKAFSRSGVLSGSGKFVADGVVSLAVYGDDPSTPEIEGPKPGEEVQLVINNQVVNANVRWTEFGDVFDISGNLTVLAVETQNGVPQSFALHQNYPNPFNPTTQISYDLPRTVRVTLTIYNVLGEVVRTLVNDEQSAGYYRVTWDSRSDNGLTVASGIYTYRIIAKDATTTFVKAGKMILMK